MRQPEPDRQLNLNDETQTWKDWFMALPTSSARPDLGRILGKTIDGLFDQGHEFSRENEYVALTLNLSDGSELRLTGVRQAELIPPTTCPTCGHALDA